MLEDKDNFYCLNSITVDTYIIGYNPQGESIVNIIKSDGNSIFTFVIDSFKSDTSFITKEILEKEKIKKLNMLCWSHPHVDHSKGIDILLDSFTDKNTEIWIPERSIELDEKVSDYSKSLFNKLLNESKSKNGVYKVYTISDKKDMLYYQKLKRLKYRGIDYQIEMNSLAPNSCNQLLFEKDNYFNINEESIVFYFSIGATCFLFTGDSCNEEFDNIPEDAFPKIIYFNKIPHHGSLTSSSLLRLIKDKGNIACTTIYKSGKSTLPNSEIINQYKEKFDEIYNTCTKKDTTYDYGYIHIHTDVINKTYSVETIGLASKL